MKHCKPLFHVSAVVGLLINLIRVISELAYKASTFEEVSESFLQGFVRTFALLLFLSGMSFFTVRLLNKWRLTWKRSPVGRAAVELGLVLVVVALVAAGAYAVTFAGIEATEGEIGRFLWMVCLSVFLMAASAFGFVELWFGILENRRLERSITRLEHEKIKSQYSALRKQLDPHFLFNNLNTLSSLIYKDVRQADQFIQEFSEVYRYVLQLNQQSTVTLAEELDFLKSYLFLLDIRFGDSLQVHIDVDPALNMASLPPLSLQLLVENAIKHNEVSQPRPLYLRIESHEGCIFVTNNVQPRLETVRSLGFGWKNLRQRYALIGAPKPTYQVNEKRFVARIPLVYVKDEVRRIDH